MGAREETRGRELLQRAVDAIHDGHWGDLTSLLQQNASELQSARRRLEQQELDRHAARSQQAAADSAKHSSAAAADVEAEKQAAKASQFADEPSKGSPADATKPRASGGRHSTGTGQKRGGDAGTDYGELFMRWITACAREVDRAPWKGILAVQVLVLAAYGPAFFYQGYIMDDAVAIQKNVNVVGETVSFADFFGRDYWGLPMHGATWTNKSFRPLTTLTFRWNYLLHGLLSSGFHIANVLLHCLASIVVGYSALSLAGLPGSWAAFCSALFGVHPIHTENVLYLVGRADILTAVIGLAALNIYAGCFCPAPLLQRGVGCLKGSLAVVGNKRLMDTFATWRDLLWMAVVAFLIVASGLCKETGFVLFGMPFLMEVFDFVRMHDTAVRKGQPIHPRVLRRLRNRLIALVLTTFLTFIARYRHTGGTKLNMSPQDNPISFESSWRVRALSYALLHGVYAKLLFWPKFLCYDYSMDAIPLVRTMADPRLLITMAAYVAAMASVTAALRSRHSQRRSALLALALLAASYLPASNILFPVGTVIGERLLYVPSIGFCLAVAVWLHSTFDADSGSASTAATAVTSMPTSNRTVRHGALIFAGLVVPSVLAVRTFLRVCDWSSSDTLFKRDGYTQPTSAKTQFNLGITHMGRQEWDSAVEALVRCAWADPLSSLPFYRIGQIEILRGNYASAESWLAASLDKFGASLMVPDEEVFHDLGVALFQNGKHEKAERRLTIALQLNPDFAKGWNNLACCLINKNMADAARAVRKAVSLDPGNPQYWANFALLAGHAGDHETSAEAWQNAQTLYPGMPEPRDCTWEFAVGRSE
eukprot:TRINITY_DN34153_c0_g1_i1.p1 TRINITY_DN34153_c0_g1~~TRINITY_DN34153_c0_g1_i1.p1  ORF type:complete len:839 (+),score=118.24 TRINITY_DN34153_c0_g1_i1:52-2517(+)